MKKSVLLFSLFALFAGATLAFAQSRFDAFEETSKLGREGIVAAAPCEGVTLDGDKPIGLGCQLCDLVKLADKLIYWMVLFSFGVAIFLFIYGGYFIMFYAASEHFYEQGKEIIWGTVVGLVIVLTSWVLINTLFVVFKYKPSGGLPWNQIECGGNPLSRLPAQRERVQDEIRLSQQNILSLENEKAGLTSDVNALRNRTRQTLTAFINEIDAQITAIKNSPLTEADTFKISLLESKKTELMKELNAIPK